MWWIEAELDQTWNEKAEWKQDHPLVSEEFWVGSKEQKENPEVFNRVIKGKKKTEK